MKMTRSALDNIIALTAILFALVYQVVVVSRFGLPFDFFIANSLILFCCLILALFGSRYPSGPYQSVMTFYAIFFGIIPALHLSQGIVMWGADPIVLKYYSITSILGLICIVFFHVSYFLSSRRYISVNAKSPECRSEISATKLVFLSFFAAAFVYGMNNFSIESVFVRSGAHKNILQVGQTWTLVYQIFLFPIPSIAFLLYAAKSKRFDVWYAALAILMVLANPPTGMARFQAAALYLAVIAVTVPKIMQIRVALPAMLSFGMLFIFPALDAFRRLSPERPIPSWSLDFLYVGHFDSFQSLASALAFGDVSWGRSLMGVMLFFVPRSIWPEKPIGSGAFMAEQEGFSFANISMNYIGEGYLNFGVFGAIGFMIVAGFLLGQVDFRFWRRPAGSARFRVQYLILVGLVFFIARGDLLSSFAYTCSMLLSTWVVARVSRSRKGNYAIVA